MKKYSDELVRSWWEQFGDIPINEEDETLDEDFIIPDVVTFEKGTDKEDVWHWFDNEYSNGLYRLMFSNP